MNYVKCFIGGNIAREPELRATPSGMNVCEFTVAVGRNKNKAGEREVDFYTVKAFDRNAELISQYFHKGRPIFIEGKPSVEKWTDKATGADRQRIIFIVDRWEFCGDGRKEKSEGDEGGGNAVPLMTPPAYRRPKKPEPEPAEVQEEIPF